MKTINYKGYEITTALSEETTHAIVDEAIKQGVFLHDAKQTLVPIKQVNLTIQITYAENSLAINLI